MHDLNTLNNNVDNNPYGMYGLRDPDCETNSAYKTILDNAVDYSDTAIVVLSRQGGESDDIPEWTRIYKNISFQDITKEGVNITKFVLYGNRLTRFSP
jgi:hypothetical protein